ncbi:ClbS/DfsB family four-helix bundle protein [Mycolicibacterium sp. YH-1]|uniref:ClbS/DfsB family four-helix bundle protein n=1 Tax=Mycolicibacterium sp. YH-1 TaxID=2908837 RepID=UPI001F4BD8DE|nr:ClbS/DfsB family four-helix bundle protein [Mycolicibacterium sp. YH-1]UNB51766.1 ClbS/DfsB family four-helix bundle protein [Mycolicibacterium sp. YH-1]
MWASSLLCSEGKQTLAVPSSKEELVHAITGEYDKLVRDLARVPAEQVRERSLPGHKANTLMSPADLLAYLLGWSELILTWHEQRDAGIEPSFPASGYNWNQLGDLAQQFYRDYASLSWTELLDRFNAAESRVLSLVLKMSDEDLYGKPWYGKYTAGRMIQLNTSSPYANARRRIRSWLRENNL